MFVLVLWNVVPVFFQVSKPFLCQPWNCAPFKCHRFFRISCTPCQTWPTTKVKREEIPINTSLTKCIQKCQPAQIKLTLYRALEMKSMQNQHSTTSLGKSTSYEKKRERDREKVDKKKDISSLVEMSTPKSIHRRLMENKMARKVIDWW